jgi:hypothetical protein
MSARPPGARSPAPGAAPSVGRTFDVAAGVLRRRWSTALLLSLLLVGPGALLTAALGQRFNAVALDLLPRTGEGLAGGALLTTADAERLIGAMVAYAAATAVAGVLGSVAAVSLARVAQADRLAEPDDMAIALRSGLRRSPSVIAFSLVSSVIIAAIGVAAASVALASVAALSGGDVSSGGPGAFLALVAGVAAFAAVAWLTLRWALVFPLMAIEDAGWRAAMGRSWQLSAGHLWRVLGVVVLGTIVTLLLSAFVAQVLAIILVDWLAPAMGLDRSVIESVVVAFATVLLAPLTPLLLAVLCEDLRRRVEPRLPPG